MPKPEWEEYQAPDDSETLDEVYHIAHVSDALRIVEDERIRSSLVWDQSKLTNTRTCVSWVSANWWNNGSLYGNVVFVIKWSKLVSGRKLYWVEDVKKYRPPAYRILVTDKDHSSSPLVQFYDPATAKGPVVIRQDGTWSVNTGGFTSEFLIDGDIPLEDCIGIRFINHNICPSRGPTCPDLDTNPVLAAWRFLSAVMGRQLVSCRQQIVNEDSNHHSVANLLGKLKRLLPGTPSSVSPPQVDLIVNSALSAYGENRDEDCKGLLSIIGDGSVFENAFRRTAEAYFCRKLPWG